MTIALRQYPGLFVGIDLRALPACATRQVSADLVVIPDTMPSADHGALQIAFAPREVSFEEQQANAATQTTSFHVFLDGEQLV